MAVFADPEDTETRALHDYADFNGKCVLEIGCGDGRLTWRYADRAASVVAIDPKAEDIEIALEDCPEELRHKIEFRVARLEELEIPAEKFDLALLSWSL
ncbi:MAG TPA: class I SAM-dependent methyltransferase [Anaerolineae bacterium]|nr:class I SAM-dependent methyltransferase [Anaerolineae bacterium]